MEAGGYQRREWWSSSGWEWRQAEEIASPFYPIPENLDLPMWGLSFYEAEAYGHFQGKRLPSEREWEIAAQQGLLNQGYVWEWTQSPFAPYPGFQSYPYRGILPPTLMASILSSRAVVTGRAPFSSDPHFAIGIAAPPVRCLLERATFTKKQSLHQGTLMPKFEHV